MRTCFVPGCDQKHKERRPMYNVPKNKTLFKQWQQVLPKYRPLRPNDHVCCLHFKEHETKRFFNHIINGELSQLERDRARLSADAVPSLHIPSEEEILKMLASNKSIKKTRQKSIVAAKSLEEAEQEVDLERKMHTNIEIIVQQPEETQINAEENFNNLFDDIFEVILPNTLWGIQRCPTRRVIYFSYMDVERLQHCKLLTINAQGQFNSYLHGRLFQSLTISNMQLTAEYVSELLDTLHQIKLCNGAHTNMNCELQLQITDKDTNCEINLPQTLCNNCLKYSCTV